MQAMRFFIDTHHRDQKTFPENLTPEQFKMFYDAYVQACHIEKVIPLQTHVGYEAGRAFCINMAENAEAVRRTSVRDCHLIRSLKLPQRFPDALFFKKPLNSDHLTVFCC